MSSLIVTIPMKDPLYAKTRMRSTLSDGGRALLARQLYRRTLQFFLDHFPQLPLAVVTDSEAMAAMAASFGASVYRDNRDKQSGASAEVEGGEDNLNAALQLATAANVARGFCAQLILPADIGLLVRAEIEVLLAAAQSAPCVVIAQAKDLGTNALLTSPPDVIHCAFGARSSLVHAALAAAAGLVPELLQLTHLRHDVDWPQDLSHMVDAISTGQVNTVRAINAAEVRR